MWVKNLLFKSSGVSLLLFFLYGCSDMHQRSVPYEHSLTAPDEAQYDSSVSANIEGIHRWTLRPYRVMGETYRPKIDAVGTSYEGIASWYGPDFHGKKTSSGEVYDMYDLSAAHKTLPMNTMIRVTNKYNKKSIVVRVNDRGPFVEGRIVDLSFSAGKKIGLDKTGIAPVTLEVLGYDAAISARLQLKPVPAAVATAEKTAAPVKAVPKPKAPVKVAKAEPAPEPELKKAVGPLYFVQLGSFKNRDGAQKLKDGAAFVFVDREVKITTAQQEDSPLYKVMVGGFKSEDDAKIFIEKNSIMGARVALEN